MAPLGPSSLTQIWILLILIGVCLLPGSALLAVSGVRRRWPGLQRGVVAVGLSLAFYPVLFYLVRFLLPTASLNRYGLGVILLLAALITGWGWWWQGRSASGENLTAEDAKNAEKKEGRWAAAALSMARRFKKLHAERRFRAGFQLGWLEWAALGVIGLTMASRLWFAHVHPFPAWSDSLHHTLLTQLTAEQGRLPFTLQPYFPNTLELYHLGLYALSGSVQMLAQVPAHTALLWTAQFLNGLAGLGVYLALDRYIGRTGAVAGTAVVGLFSAHPALWANWGRFTQLSSQTILLIALVLTVEAVRVSGQSENDRRIRSWLILFAALSNAAVFLFHFRVAIFYFLLLLPTLAILLWKEDSWRGRGAILKYSGAIAIIALLIILPALWEAAEVYFAKQLGPKPAVTPAQRAQVLQNYYRFPLSTVPYLVAPVWLLSIGAAAGLVGLIRRNVLTLIALLWTLLLLLLGNAYRLRIPALNVTNLGAILIMLYLPLGLIIGVGVEEGVRLIPERYRRRATAVLITLLLIAALPAAYARATTVEPERHFMTAADRAAMGWIEANVPPEATFAINTYFWLPNFAHGTDAGYWIPYLTERDIVTSAMLSDGLPAAYREQVVAQSRATETLATDPTAVNTLYELGVRYIYVGKKGDFTGPALDPEQLKQVERVELLYQNDGTAIFRIKPPR